jgi:hypothetical protein
MVDDQVIPGETNTHYCVFTRNEYVWQQVTQACDYTAPVWTYTAQRGNDYCDYKFSRDVFTHPTYSYSYIPNSGDILGQTQVTYNGNDDLNGKPTAVTYSGGSFSNGDCPNLIMNSAVHPECSNGVLCKLSWTSNTTIGATNYPRGRYTGVTGGPWAVAPAAYPSAEPTASLTDPLFPPDPLLYRSDWLTPSGSGVLLVHLMANYYDPSASNPRRPAVHLRQLQLPVRVRAAGWVDHRRRRSGAAHGGRGSGAFSTAPGGLHAPGGTAGGRSSPTGPGDLLAGHRLNNALAGPRRAPTDRSSRCPGTTGGQPDRHADPRLR